MRDRIDIKIKKLSDTAKLPTQGHNTDAGWDLYADSITGSSKYGYIQINTGVAVDIPEGYVGYLFPRSSVSKTNLTLANCVGVVDTGYHGPLCLRFKPTGDSAIMNVFPYTGMSELRDYEPDTYNIGDKCGQLIIMPIPQVNFTEVESFEESDRGEGGFGSTGS